MIFQGLKIGTSSTFRDDKNEKNGYSYHPWQFTLLTRIPQKTPVPRPIPSELSPLWGLKDMLE